MFGLFKRTKVEDWEIQLLLRILNKLPEEFNPLSKQIKDGLFRSVILNASDISGYVAFGFNYEVYKKYNNEKEANYKLSGIKVFDNKSSSFLNYSIYISHGVINGYSLDGGKKHQLDLNNIDISLYKKVYTGLEDFNRISSLFDENEKLLFSPSDVYVVNIDNKEYFHIKDLEDGDFIGIDENKIIYEITHDPMEVRVIDKPLKDVLNGL